MIETWKKHLDKGDKIRVILMAHLTDFEIINHRLLLTKLEAYGIS